VIVPVPFSVPPDCTFSVPTVTAPPEASNNPLRFTVLALTEPLVVCIVPATSTVPLEAFSVPPCTVTVTPEGTVVVPARLSVPDCSVVAEPKCNWSGIRSPRTRLPES
jgi:hypothetical protein